MGFEGDGEGRVAAHGAAEAFCAVLPTVFALTLLPLLASALFASVADEAEAAALVLLWLPFGWLLLPLLLLILWDWPLAEASSSSWMERSEGFPCGVTGGLTFHDLTGDTTGFI